MNRARNQKGFTLTELIVVIAIIGILVGMAIMSVTEYRRRTALKESARALEGFFYNARTAARTRQVPVTVSLTAWDYTSSAGVVLDSGTVNRDVQLQDDPDPPAPFAIPGNIVFTSMGTVDTAATVVRVRIVSLTDPNRRYRVCVYQTGGTRVERLESGAWTRAW